MIYPDNYEKKIGFAEVRALLKGHCLSPLGQEEADGISYMTDHESIARALAQVSDLRRVMEEDDEFPLANFYDCRANIQHLRLEGTHLEEEQMYHLVLSLMAVEKLREHLRPQEVADEDMDEEETAEEEVDETYAKTRKGEAKVSQLWELARNVNPFPQLIRRMKGILDKTGHIKDSASSTLFRVRRELRIEQSSVGQTLNSILRQAQMDGYVDRDVTPAMRDGRLVIPVSPAMKRKIQGIVHDESATGKTLFVEPAAVVEANNRIHELEAEEKREMLRILTEVSAELRPYYKGLLRTQRFLAQIDLIQAKLAMAKEMKAVEPMIEPEPHMDWIQARHPLLARTLEKQGKSVVPLDLTLERGVLVISGPNAGGKSVCLKTVGLVQYMLQCGLLVPMSDRSTMGIFSGIMIDIGDEQSIDDDLSTYSSHLRNMKMMIRHASASTLLLIDEFGTGTEPQIGGAIAEAVLTQFWKKRTWGVITTHYSNLKHFADEHKGVTNGAMLYDRHEMRALFQLQIGRPGSSFAIEIARKTGLPEEVIQQASDIVGQDYIQSDKYLQDIVRDKRYWEQKRESVHRREKDVERTISKFEDNLEEIDRERKAILRRAKEQADELIREANRRIENTIREIREAEAEKNVTRRLRKEMDEFKEEVAQIDAKATDAMIEKKMQQILARRERHEKRKTEKAQKAAQAPQTPVVSQQSQEPSFVREGNYVKIKGTRTVGLIESIQGKTATVIIGDMRTKMKLSALEQGEAPKQEMERSAAAASRTTREVVDEHRSGFRPEIDVMGLRGDEALLQVQRFVDDAILMGAQQVRILHGKGNGILRQLIRQYLKTVPNVVSCRDEHVQFGGAGITVVEL